MIDWTRSMQQTYTFYEVDPYTWKNKRELKTITTQTINYDASLATLGSSSLQCTEDIGEIYVRTYLKVTQDKETTEIPLGTFLFQSPQESFDGKVTSRTLDGYTSLIELKENKVPLGYSILKGRKIMELASRLCSEHTRAPVISVDTEDKLQIDFVSNEDDTWLTFNSDLIANAKYYFDTDAMGNVLFAPKQDINALQPVVIFGDDSHSILYPQVTVDKDIYTIPNVVEVIYTTSTHCFYSRVVNDDSNSATSTIARGREIIYRETNPNMIANPTQSQVDQYAEQLLKTLSSAQCTISYTRGYYPVRVGDCVGINYTRANINNVKAIVTSQSIQCTPGCQIDEKAMFNINLWR